VILSVHHTLHYFKVGSIYQNGFQHKGAPLAIVSAFGHQTRQWLNIIYIISKRCEVWKPRNFHTCAKMPWKQHKTETPSYSKN